MLGFFLKSISLNRSIKVLILPNSYAFSLYSFLNSCTFSWKKYPFLIFHKPTKLCYVIGHLLFLLQEFIYVSLWMNELTNKCNCPYHVYCVQQLFSLSEDHSRVLFTWKSWLYGKGSRALRYWWNPPAAINILRSGRPVGLEINK